MNFNEKTTYHNKYIRNKNKYLLLKKREDYGLKGGTNLDSPTIYPKFCGDFDSSPLFDLVGQGTEGKVYRYNSLPVVYKKMVLTKPMVSAWVRPPASIYKKDINLVGGVTNENFDKICDRYRKASDLGLGPKFFFCYTCDNSAIIVMEEIDGLTLKDAKKKGVLKNGQKFELDQKLKAEMEYLVKKLISEGIFEGGILADIHHDNFMITNNKKIYAIDF